MALGLRDEKQSCCGQRRHPFLQRLSSTFYRFTHSFNGGLKRETDGAEVVGFGNEAVALNVSSTHESKGNYIGDGSGICKDSISCGCGK